MKQSTKSNSSPKPQIRENTNTQKPTILTHRIQRVKHLNHNQHSQTQSARLLLPTQKVVTIILKPDIGNFYIPTLRPIPQNIQTNYGVLVVSPVIGNVVVNENTSGGDSHIKPHDHITSKDPSIDDIFVFAPWRFLHRTRVGFIET